MVINGKFSKKGNGNVISGGKPEKIIRNSQEYFDLNKWNWYFS
jgi:hypothetical protein